MAVKALKKPEEGNTFLQEKKTYQTYEPGKNLLKGNGQH